MKPRRGPSRGRGPGGRRPEARLRSTEAVSCEVSGGVGWITLCRPVRGNRLDGELAAALVDACAEMEDAEGVHVVMLRARGKAFCAGPALGPSRAGGLGPDPVAAVAAITKPVVAVVGGEAVGAGCELALACDLRLASTGASFALPQIARGGFPCFGATQRLPRLVGRTRALEMLLLGTRVSAREALRMGLVSRVVEQGRLAAVAAELASELAARAPLALRLAKEAVWASGDLTLEQGLRLEEDLYVLLQTTADRIEGVRAFLEKRPPRFGGR